MLGAALVKGGIDLEIVAALRVGMHTVQRHLQSAYREIGVRNRADTAAPMARVGG